MAAADVHPHPLKSSSTPEFLTPAQHFQRLLEIPVSTIVLVAVLFSMTFLNLVDISHDSEKKGLDLLILLKLCGLAVAGLYGFVGLLTQPKVRAMLFSLPVIWMVIIFCFYCLALPGAEDKTEALASTLSIACVLLLTVTAVVRLGVRSVLMVVFYALATFIILSWVAFFLTPEFGIYQEPLGDGEFATRMSGLSHPNTLGQFAGVTIILGLVLGKTYGQRSRWRYAIIALAVGALVFSLSRTSLLSTIMATIVVFRQDLFQPKYLIRWIGLATVGFFGLAVIVVFTDVARLAEGNLSIISKSGEFDELTTATGRTEIWSHALSLIGQRPLTGYGASSAQFYFVDHSSHPHNLLLNIAFATGIFGGLAALLMCLGRAWSVLLARNRVADPLLAFVLVNGLFETVIFSILAGMPTIIWTIALCIPETETGADRSLDQDDDSGSSKGDSTAVVDRSVLFRRMP